MEFTIKIEDSSFEKPIEDAVSRQVNSVVNEVVRKKIESYQSEIEKAVELYLSKRMSDTNVKSEIDKAIARIVEEKLNL